ncbi:hypothetical protein AB0M45_11010 [Nocardia sp. NPDC051787]
MGQQPLIPVYHHRRRPAALGDAMAISIARITGQDYTNSASITAIIESK